MTAARKAPARPDLHQYHDYRAFLRDWFEHLKASRSRFSLRAICRRASLAPSFLSMVLKGTRNLTTKALDQLWPHLHLPEKDRGFLESLIRIADSPSATDRVLALKRLQRFSNYRRKNPAELELYRYLTRWYYVAIRELAFCQDFRDEPEWIQSRLSFTVSLSEIREALEFLKSTGLLEQRQGRWLPGREVNLQCEAGVFRVSLAEFHQQMLDLVKLAITDIPRDERHILGQTVAVTASGFERIKQILGEAQSEVVKYEQQDHGAKDRVYHIALCAIPVAKRKEGSSEK